MSKLKPALFILLLCAICFLIPVISSYASEESLTITTYYPSPYGSYRELRSQRIAIGNTYINRSTACWDPPCPGGGTDISDSASRDIDLIVQGNVGIGTVNPNAKLDVRPSDTSRPTNLCVRMDYTSSSGTTNCPSGYYIAMGSYAGMVTPPVPGYIICCQACIDNNSNGICD